MENAAKDRTRPAAPGPLLPEVVTSPAADAVPVGAQDGVRIHRIADDNDIDDTILSAVGAGAPPPLPPAFARQEGRTAASAHANAGSVATARVNDVRPPYRPPQALRMNIARAQAAQPRLINMSDGRRSSAHLPGGLESAV